MSWRAPDATQPAGTDLEFFFPILFCHGGIPIILHGHGHGHEVTSTRTCSSIVSWVRFLKHGRARPRQAPKARGLRIGKSRHLRTMSPLQLIRVVYTCLIYTGFSTSIGDWCAWITNLMEMLLPSSKQHSMLIAVLGTRLLGGRFWDAGILT